MTISLRSARAAGFPVAVVLLALLAAPAEAQPRRVAVLDFANTTKDASVDWLGPAAAETITTKLNAIRALQLVERLQVYKVLDEQKLALSDLVDPSQAVKLGQLLGAQQVVLGSHAVFGGTVRFAARFVDVTTGAIVATSQVNGVLDPRNPDGLWAALDQLAQAAINSLNTRVAIVQGTPQLAPVSAAQRIEPTPEERARFARAPSVSLSAQEAYGGGLNAFKRHQFAAAARALERATALDADNADAWRTLGRAQEKLGQWQEGLAASQKAHELYARAGDAAGQARTLIDIGNIYWFRGRNSEGLDHYERALRVAEGARVAGEEVRALDGLGNAYSSQGRYREALDYYDRSLRLGEAIGDAAAQARALHNLGSAYGSLGRVADSLSYLERSLRLKERLGDEPSMIVTLRGIGLAHRSRDRYTEAQSYYERALSLAERLEYEREKAGALVDMGELHAVRKNYAEALDHYHRGLAINQKLGDDPQKATVLRMIGWVHGEQGRAGEALSYYQQSLRVSETLDDDRGKARAQAGIAYVLARERRYGEGLRYVEAALGFAERVSPREREDWAKLRDWLRNRAR